MAAAAAARYPKSGCSNSDDPLQMVRGRHVVVDRLLQLCRPSSRSFRCSKGRCTWIPATRNVRFGHRVGLRALLADGGTHCRSRARKSASLGGLHAWSLICMATVAGRSFPALVFFRVAEDLGETFYFPASVSLVSAYHGKETRPRALGLHQTNVYIGTIAAASSPARHRTALRMALVVHRFRRTRSAADPFPVCVRAVR